MSLKRILEESSRFIKIKSVSDSGNEELVNYIEGWLQGRGFETKIQQVMHSLRHISKRQYNLIGILGDPLVDRKIKTGLLLINHLDTASLGDREGWVTTEGDPFSMSIKENCAFGLGSSSGKLDFLCRLIAAQKFRNRKLKMPLYLAGVCGGEHSFFGTTFLLQSLALNPKYVLVGVPTDVQLGVGGAGFWLGKIVFRYPVMERGARGFNRKILVHSKGEGAHPSFTKEGRNAIEQLLDFLNLCFESGFEMKFTQIEGGEPVPGVPIQSNATLFLTSHQLEDFKRFFQELVRSEKWENRFSIEVGGLGESGLSFLPPEIFKGLLKFKNKIKNLQKADGVLALNAFHLNQEPGKMEWVISGTIQEGIQGESIKAPLMELAAEMSEKNPNINVEIKNIKIIEPFQSNQENEFYDICCASLKSKNIEIKKKRFDFYSQAGMFASQGYDTLMFGPGESNSNWHQKNERVRVDDLEKIISFYEELIERVCL